MQGLHVGAGAAPAGTSGAGAGATPDAGGAGGDSAEAALQGFVDLFLMQSAVAAARTVLTCDIAAGGLGRGGWLV